MRISDWSSDVCSSDLRIDIRPSRQRARYGLDRFQARTKTGDRFLVAFQLTIGKIGDLKICDTAEGGPCELRPHLALAGIGCDKEQPGGGVQLARSEEHTSELQSLMRISYAVFCLKKKTNQ